MTVPCPLAQGIRRCASRTTCRSRIGRSLCSANEGDGRPIKVPAESPRPFMPFPASPSRVTGLPSSCAPARASVEMIYDRAGGEKGGGRSGRHRGPVRAAELTIGAGRPDEAARLIECKTALAARCLSENVDFRAAVHQQLYKVRRAFGQSAIRAGRNRAGIEQVPGHEPDRRARWPMKWKRCFALAEAYQRKGDFATRRPADTAASSAAYGHYEYPICLQPWPHGQERLMTGARE